MITETVALLRQLIAFPSVSSRSNLDIAHFIADTLRAAGARVDVWQDPGGQKANVFATLGPDTDGGIVLSGHMDVVPVDDQVWATDPFTVFEKQGRLYGRGTCDMKGFIAACLAYAPVFARSATVRPLHFAFTYDEEVGCLGGRALVDTLKQHTVRPSIAIIGEPTSMRIVEGHKGCCEYTTRFTGLAGHGSSPSTGVNAVEYAVRYVGQLLALGEELALRAPENSPFDPPWTTINVGALRGGVAHNVIPSTAEVDWEMRPVQDGDAEQVHSTLDTLVHKTLLPAMRAVYPEADITTEVIGEVAGLLPRGNNEARALVAELTGDDEATTVAFSTEAGLFQALGLSAVVCGPGSIEQAHKADEFIAVSELERCLQLFEALAPTLGQPA